MKRVEEAGGITASFYWITWRTSTDGVKAAGADISFFKHRRLLKTLNITVNYHRRQGPA